MDPRFYLNQYRALEVEMSGQHEVILAPRFSRNENQDKCDEYLRKVAQELTEVYTQDPAKATEILDEAKYQVRRAKSDESALKEVTFS